MRLFLLIGLLLTGVVAMAQKVRTVSATYTYHAPETMSVEEAKRIAIDRAKIQAIADAFGSTVTQSSSTIVSNLNGVSDSQFFSMGGSDVKGEWIETLGEPDFQIKHDGNILNVTCSIKGRVRELIHPEIELTAKVLKNGTSLKYESDRFKDGDEVYLFFQSTEDGNISVYLRQNDSVYRLLPYKGENRNGFPVSKNTPYTLFSKKNSTTSDKTDEYVLYADNEIDMADVIILYTPNLSSLPPTDAPAFDRPLSLDLPAFNRWLVKKRNTDLHSRIVVLPITISKGSVF